MGNRIISKYYDQTFPSVKEQEAFETKLFQKTHRANAEIIMLEGLTCVYRGNVDSIFLAIDEVCDHGIILESDAAEIAKRIHHKQEDSATMLGENSMAQVLQSAKEQIKWSLLK